MMKDGIQRNAGKDKKRKMKNSGVRIKCYQNNFVNE